MVTILAPKKTGKKKRMEQKKYLALSTVKLGFSGSIFQHAIKCISIMYQLGHILFATFVQVKFRRFKVKHLKRFLLLVMAKKLLSKQSSSKNYKFWTKFA